MAHEDDGCVRLDSPLPEVVTRFADRWYSRVLAIFVFLCLQVVITALLCVDRWLRLAIEYAWDHLDWAHVLLFVELQLLSLLALPLLLLWWCRPIGR